MARMKKGMFKAGYHGYFRRNRWAWKAVKQKKGKFYDVMGGGYKSKKTAASQNAFISGMGL